MLKEKQMNLQFDPEKHIYKLDGKIIPGVTDIINELLPQYNVPDWYLTRGRAVHKAAAFIAKGIDFDYDDRIAGQVAAIRKFFAEIKPEIIQIETIVYSEPYRYAGTFDLYAKINNKYCLIDYKSSISIERVGLQTAGYSIPMWRDVIYGIGIAIKEDGNYRMMDKPINLKKYCREFLALRSAYAIKERLGVKKKQED